MNTTEEQLTIQHVAEITGLSVYTLRYYEGIGLIHPIERAENTHRRYTMDDIGWIEFLNKLRAMGMSIQEMQTYAELQRQGDVSLSERVEMLKHLRSRVESCMQELQENLNMVNYKITFYEGVIAEKNAGSLLAFSPSPRSLS
jgi:DNA-binding transcriptional MerR regulator